MGPWLWFGEKKKVGTLTWRFIWVVLSRVRSIVPLLRVLFRVR